MAGLLLPPMPFRVTAWAAPPLLSRMMMVAARGPSASGVNRTLTLALPPGNSVKDREPLMLKSPLLAPASSMPVTLTAAPPVLLTVSGRLAVVFSAWF